MNLSLSLGWCVILGKLLNHSDFDFLIHKMGRVMLLSQDNANIYVKCFHDLAHKQSVTVPSVDHWHFTNSNSLPLF